MNISQKEELVGFVSTNYDKLFNRKSKNTAKLLWQDLTIKLNAIGTRKQPEAWKQCFIRLKAAAKLKSEKGGKLNYLESKIIHCGVLSLNRLPTRGSNTVSTNPTSTITSGAYQSIYGATLSVPSISNVSEADISHQLPSNGLIVRLQTEISFHFNMNYRTNEVM